MNTRTSSAGQDIWGAIQLDGAAGSVRFERQFATTAADLWATVTDPDRLSRWFGPVRGELALGGTYDADLGSDGISSGRVLACDPGRSYTVSWEDDGNQESEIDVEVRPTGDTAVLVLHHRGLPVRYLADYGAGWQGFLAQIDAGTVGDANRRYPELMPSYQEICAAAGVPEWARSIDGVLRRRDGLPAVRFDRHYATTRADLWSAVTDPVRLARWFMPVSGDLRAGGTYTVDYGEQGTASGTVLECDPGRTFSVSWQIGGADAGVVSVEIIDTPGDLLLRLNHVRLPEDQGVGYAAGWHAYLDALRDHLTGDQGPAFDDRWSTVVGSYRSLGALTLA